MKKKLILLIVALFVSVGFLTSCEKKTEVWIYTSLYKSTISELEPHLKKEFPGVKINFYQGGSEIVASKIGAELAGGKTKADLIITSDPFWYLEMKEKGHLLSYQSPAAKNVPISLSDPDHYFTCNRIPVMVMAYNSEKVPANEIPKGFLELSESKWKDKISMGNPLQSGTNFTTVSFLSKKFGWDYFKTLRKQNIISAGGNSSVLNRMETGERPIGVILLENLIKAAEKGSPVKPIYPVDGAIAIPSPIAMTKYSENPELVKKIYDWFFSDVAQNAIVSSGMYSPLPRIAPPKGAPRWVELQKRIQPWTPNFLKEILVSRNEIKKKFSEIILHQ